MSDDERFKRLEALSAELWAEVMRTDEGLELGKALAAIRRIWIAARHSLKEADQ